MQVILFCFIAGIVGICLGCFLLFALGDISTQLISRVLSFAGGIMVSLVCFDLVPEAVSLSGFPLTAAGIAAGLLLILLVDCIAHRIMAPGERFSFFHSHGEGHHGETSHGDGHHGDSHASEVRHTEVLHSERRHGDGHHGAITETDRLSLIRSGMLMLIAIGLHNFPEGLAIGSGGMYDARLGLVLTATIMLHNIPTGMGIAAPLLAGGMDRKQIITLTALTGSTTLAGGALGLLAGSISDVVLSLSLAGAGGTMLYVVFMEIIPQSLAVLSKRWTTLMTLVGLAAGFLLTLLP